MTPEEKAREEIDRALVACGWIVHDHRAMIITAGPGVAVRAELLKPLDMRPQLRRQD